jgi:NTE family protein
MRSAFAVIGLCTVLLGCASIQNAPVNQPGSSADLAGQLHENFEERSATDDDLVALSFSGGGTRAAAFSFGVLEELAQTPVRGGGASMIDRIDFISGVSGGSVTAAYFGLRKRAAMADFREKFLLRNAEEGLQTNLNLATLSKAFAGGINDSNGLPRWLDANLFHGATFADLRKTVRPRVWINASDI